MSDEDLSDEDEEESSVEEKATKNGPAPAVHIYSLSNYIISLNRTYFPRQRFLNQTIR